MKLGQNVTALLMLDRLKNAANAGVGVSKLEFFLSFLVLLRLFMVFQHFDRFECFVAGLALPHGRHGDRKVGVGEH